jgi:hypothetical protein
MVGEEGGGRTAYISEGLGAKLLFFPSTLQTPAAIMLGAIQLRAAEVGCLFT